MAVCGNCRTISSAKSIPVGPFPSSISRTAASGSKSAIIALAPAALPATLTSNPAPVKVSAIKAWRKVSSSTTSIRRGSMSPSLAFCEPAIDKPINTQHN